jgi:hypothetical protein
VLGLHDRLAEPEERVGAHERGGVVLPALEVGVIGEHQVGVGRALVEEGGEAHDERDLLERAAHPGGLGGGEEGIGIVEEQRIRAIRLPLEDRLGERAGNVPGQRGGSRRGAVEPHARDPVRGRLVQLDLGQGLQRDRVREHDAARHVDAPHQCIERVDCHRAVDRVAGGHLAEGDRGPVAGELLGDAEDRRHGNPGDAGRLVGVVLLEDQPFEAGVATPARVPPVVEPEGPTRDERGVVQLLPDEHVGDAEREGALGSGIHGDPLVGLRRRDGQARLDLDDLRLASRVALSQLPVGAEPVDGRDVGVEERRAEGEQVVGVLEVVGERRVSPLRAVARQRLAEDRPRCLSDVVGGAIGPTEARDEGVHEPPALAAEKGHRVGLASLPDLAQRLGDAPDRLVPRDGLPPPLPAGPDAPERSADAVRAIEDLEPREPLRAEAAAVERVERVAGDAHGPVAHGPHANRAASVALPAHRGDPSFRPARDAAVLLGQFEEVGEPSRATAGDREARAAGAGEGEEAAPGDGHRTLLVAAHRPAPHRWHASQSPLAFRCA